MAGDGVAVLLSGFAHLVVSQVTTRLITFLLNLFIARWLTVESYGVAAVQYHLINTSALFLSREGFRRGCLRSKQSNKDFSVKQVLTTSALVLPWGLIVTSGICFLALQNRSLDAAQARGIALQGAAAILELASEPFYILAQLQLNFRLRVVVEAAATLLRGAASLLMLRCSSLPAVIALSVGQVAYAGVLVVGFGSFYLRAWVARAKPASKTVACNQSSPSQPPEAEVMTSGQKAGRPPQANALRHRIKAPFPHPASYNGVEAQGSAGPAPEVYQHQSPGGASHAECRALLLGDTTLRLVAVFTGQAAVKLLLAEGSKVAMVAFQSPTAQGVYGLVTNLGSLAVRTLFQPFEEAAYLAFSQPVSRDGATEEGAHRQRMLVLLTRGMAIIGLVAVAFGPNYAYTLLRMLYGARWADTGAPGVLGLYCAYIALLAINGILEAFVHAVADGPALTRANVWLVASSVVQVALSIALVGPAGASGLIFADSAGMVLRIGYSLAFARQYFAGCGTGVWLAGEMVPARRSLTAMGTAFVVTCMSNAVFMAGKGGLVGTSDRVLLEWLGFWPRAGLHVLVGCGALVIAMLAIWKAEQAMWTQLQSLKGLKRRKAA